MSFRFTVPGNLLLAGEYAVLEEGGLGLARAVEPFRADHDVMEAKTGMEEAFIYLMGGAEDNFK